MNQKTKAIITLLTILFFTILIVNMVILAAPEKITVGTSVDWPPYEWLNISKYVRSATETLKPGVDKSGVYQNYFYVGFDMDLIKIMAVIQEYEVEIRNYDFDFLFSAIQSSKIDLIASATSLTKERLKVLDASEPYWQFDQGLLVREDSKININTALTAGNIIGINRKTLESDRIKETISSKNIQLELYEKDTLGILDLLNKRIDAFVTDFPIAKIFARDNPINIIGTIDNKEQLVFYVKKGDPKGILPIINEGLKKIKKNTIWDNLVRVYFIADLGNLNQCYSGWSFLSEENLEEYAQKFADCMFELK